MNGAAYWKQIHLTDLHKCMKFHSNTLISLGVMHKEVAEMDREYSGQTDGWTMHLWHATKGPFQDIKALCYNSCLNVRGNLKSELSLN